MTHHPHQLTPDESVLFRLGRITDAFHLAIDTVHAIYHGVVDEESTTAAFSGSMASHSAWIVPTDGPEAPLYFGHFRKSKVRQSAVPADGLPQSFLHEIESGADLAVTVGVNANYSLVNLIQSKAGHADTGGERFHWASYRVTDGKTDPMHQLNALKSFTKALIPQPNSPVSRLSGLSRQLYGPHWVHYLVYFPSGWRTIPMPILASYVSTRAVGPTLNASLLPFVDAHNLFNFERVTWQHQSQPRAAAAAVPHSDEPVLPGWMAIPNDAIAEWISPISARFDILAIDATDGALARTLENLFRPKDFAPGDAPDRLRLVRMRRFRS